MLSLMFLCSHSCHHGAGLCAQWHPSLPANNDKMALLSSPVSHLLQYLLSCGQEGKEVGILQACNLTEHRIFVFWDLNTCGLESQFFDWFWGIITLVKEDFVNRFLWAHYGESKMARVNRVDEEMRDRVGQSDARPSCQVVLKKPPWPEHISRVHSRCLLTLWEPSNEALWLMSQILDLDF